MTKERIYEPRTEVIQTVFDYLNLSKKFNKPPEVQLRLASQPVSGDFIDARSVAISKAIQCYSPGVAKLTQRTSEKELGIGKSTLHAGHHTTRMHTQYSWKMINVTRSATHDFFHSTPFYNSEQQSQRYVEAKSGNFLLPRDLAPQQSEFFDEACNFANESYFKLMGLLKPKVEERVIEMNPKSRWSSEQGQKNFADKVKKMTQEVARYVLPIGQHTTFDHTLSHLQLLRLFRVSKQDYVSDETRHIVGKMIAQVASFDKSILDELEPPITRRSTPSEETQDATAFDKKLNKLNTNLVASTYDPNGEALVYDAAMLADVYDIGMFDPKTSTLRENWLKFQSKMSHTADSQRQRHRRTAGKVLTISEIYKGRTDYAVPLVIDQNPDLKQQYDLMMEKMFNNVETAIKMGIPTNYAHLLIPNAISVRVTEGGDLFDWIHRWKQRLCYLAQEEIFFVSLGQVKEVIQKIPELTPVLLAPCGLRKGVGIRPQCPEGSKWCGQPVYNWQLDEYEKHRLI